MSGYSLGEDRIPSYDFKSGKHSLSVKSVPDRPLKFSVLISLRLPMEKLDFKSPNTQVEEIKRKPGSFSIVIRRMRANGFHPMSPNWSSKPTLEIGVSYIPLLMYCLPLTRWRQELWPDPEGIVWSEKEFFPANPHRGRSLPPESIEEPDG